MKVLRKALFVIALVICGAMLVLIGQLSSKPSLEQASSMQRVRETGVLRCGYFVEPPFIEMDVKTGKLTGIIPDLMEQIAQYAGIKVAFTNEVLVSTMIDDLNLGKCDMICASAGYNPIRSKQALFVEPFGYAPLYSVVRSDETRIASDLSNLETSGVVVGALDGEVGTLTAQARFPKAKYVFLPQMSDMGAVLQDVVSKKADITFVSPQVFVNYDTNNPGKLKVLSREYPLATFPGGFMVKAGDRELADFISHSQAFLNSVGVLDRILDKYDPGRQLILRPAKLYRIENER